MPRIRKNYPWLKTMVIVVVMAAAIIGYSTLKLKDIFIGPQIVLYSPIDGTNLEKDLVNIQGRAKRISQIYLNGKKIFTDEQGNFNEAFLLASGYNLIEIRAEDQFGRQVEKKLQLTVN